MGCAAAQLTKAGGVLSLTMRPRAGPTPFNYTVTLHNTGDTNIGTFWFAWT